MARGFKEAFLLSLFFIFCHSEIIESVVEYEHDGFVMEGFMAYDSQVDNTGGIMIAPTWSGLADDDRNYARHWASLGYVGFAADLYGKGIRPTTSTDKGSNATFLRENPGIHRDRAEAGLQVLLGNSQIDMSKGAVAVGYCFGSDTAFELARANPSGLNGVFGFHGSGNGILGKYADDAEFNNAIDPDMLVMYHHGSEDGVTNAATNEEVYELEDLLLHTYGTIRWQTHTYGHAAHGFASPSSSKYQEWAGVTGHEVIRIALEELWGGVKQLCSDSKSGQCSAAACDSVQINGEASAGECVEDEDGNCACNYTPDCPTCELESGKWIGSVTLGGFRSESVHECCKSCQTAYDDIGEDGCVHWQFYNNNCVFSTGDATPEISSRWIRGTVRDKN